MEFPILDRQLIAALRLSHGLFNFSVMLLFQHHGWLGLKIRRARRSHRPLPFPAIKRHRRAGPVLAVAIVLGYLFGPVIVFLDKGKAFEHPLHFLVGSALVLLIITNVILSRRIKHDSPFRTPHFVIGITILGIFVVQVFLGIGILF